MDNDTVSVDALAAQIRKLQGEKRQLERKLQATRCEAAEYRAAKRAWKQSAMAYSSCLEEHGIPLPDRTVHGYDGG